MQKASTALLKLFNTSQHQALENEARSYIKKYPQSVFGYKALAAGLLNQDKLADALTILDQALVRFPRDTELHNNRAAALIKLRKFEEALISAEAAIQLDPKNGGAYANKGLAYKKLGVWLKAIDCYYRAIELDPADFNSLNNAGTALHEMEKLEESAICFKAALALKPDFDDALKNLAYVHEAMKFFQDARREYEKVLAKEPDNLELRLRLEQIFRKECLFAKAEEQDEIILKQIRTALPSGKLPMFTILSLTDSTLEDHRITAHAHACADFADYLDTPPYVVRSVQANPQRLRIGYLSADFHHHATMMLMIGVLEAHSHEHFEFFAYSSGPDDESALRKRAVQSFDTFRNIKPLSYPEAARQIVEDGIDILVDLKGHTKDERLEICALRPAPVIVSWLGYPGTLGHPRLADYVIGDPITTPVEHQPYYSETLALMPHCYQPNDDHRAMDPKPPRHEIGLPEGATVFCSFNQNYKITAPVFQQWCRLLREVPNSVLWLLAEKTEAQDNLRAYLEQADVDPSRLIFAPHQPIAAHLGRLQHAFLALDTFPYGSHTTGSDALWAGVPFASIKGNTFASRVSSSLLASVGLSELITDSPEAACDLTIALARDPVRYQRIKQQLAEAKQKTHLFNTVEFARDLECLYRAIWNQHSQGIRSPIVLSAQS